MWMDVYNIDTPVRLAIATAAAQTAVIPANAVLLIASTDMYFTFGVNPTADAAAGIYLPAKVPLAIAWNPLNKLSGIRATADGVLSILPIG